MGERGPLIRFIRRVLISSAVWGTIVWAINTWGAFDRARQSGASMGHALSQAAGNIIVWPLFYLLVLPFVAFGTFMWQARKFGWNLGKQLTAGAAARSQNAPMAADPGDLPAKSKPIQPR